MIGDITTVLKISDSNDSVIVMTGDLFESYVMGGFECSTHRRFDGRRLDMIEATGHDRFAEADYLRLMELGIRTCRDGIRWHLIEKTPGNCDFASVRRQLNAAQRTGIQVIWDIFHYGYPDDLDIFSAEFPERFVSFAVAFTDYHVAETGQLPIICPVNEMSFFAWIAGDIGRFYPFAKSRADELKKQLVRSSILAIKTIRERYPAIRVVATEPLVNVISRPDDGNYAAEAERYRKKQFQVFDMLTGRLAPELGGKPEYLDIIGVNYYPHNQWFFPDREMIPVGDPLSRPFSDMLVELWQRYHRPIFIAETGTEDERRAPWFTYVVNECDEAIRRGVDLQGICIYPIVDHPGWEDERHCRNGLWGYCTDSGDRTVHGPLASEIKKYQVWSSARERTVAGGSE